MKNAVLRGKPYVENPHVRSDEGAVACPPKPTMGSAWLVARDSPWDPRGMFLIVK